MSVRTLSLSDVMAKINKNMDSKEDLLSLMDSLRRRAGGTFAILRPKSCKRNRLAMVKQGYIPLIVDIMHKYVNEELLVGSSCKVLFYLGSLPDSPVEDMLQLGARALVDEIMETNRDDKGNVRPEISQFNTMLNKLGGTSAVRDIRRQILALEFVKTQTLLKDAYGDRYERKPEQKPADVAYNVAIKKGPEASLVDWLYTLDYAQCIGIIVEHMSRYKAVLSVQEAGCEAFYEYARSAVDVIPCIKGGGCKSIVQAFDYFPDSPRLIWKACNAVNEMSLHHNVLAAELGKNGVIKRLVAAWEKMMDTNDSAVQQQIIWALGALAHVPINMERFKTDGVYPIVKYCVVDLPNENKKNKHKGKSALKTPLIMPLNLRQGITLEEIETYSAPPTEDTGKKKMDKAPFRGYRAKKPKFGRSGDDMTGESTGMVDDKKGRHGKKKGSGAEVSTQQ
jgi:hypothetical protein